jgi:flagellar protein FliT
MDADDTPCAKSAQEACEARGLIGHYESIARASRSMLEAARQGDWPEVEKIELKCLELIEGLKRAAAHEALGTSEKVRRVAILRAILEDDAQIRLRAEPWLRDLEYFLGSGAVPKGQP